ncbi:hypothetical protein GLP40_02540 [Nocardia sp. CT2-14]|uniref:Uncharacterized protein n=1 Tax=Nocardia aurantiaca TaxID=2675850 RepID=A0A6I3KRC1_9NOCA|nr:hypothetical protein [Nocardia aurantiaca]
MPVSTVVLVSASERSTLARYPEAAAFFETLPRQSRLAVGFHLGSAVRPQTRQRRLEQVIQKLIDGKPL